MCALEMIVIIIIMYKFTIYFNTQRVKKNAKFNETLQNLCTLIFRGEPIFSKLQNNSYTMTNENCVLIQLRFGV